jgi:hypothetical protein
MLIIHLAILNLSQHQSIFWHVTVVANIISRGIHLVSQKTAVRVCLSCYALTIKPTSIPVSSKSWHWVHNMVSVVTHCSGEWKSSKIQEFQEYLNYGNEEVLLLLLLLLLWVDNNTNVILTHKVNSSMTMVATNETCQNMDWLSENFRINKCTFCLLLEIFRQIS